MQLSIVHHAAGTNLGTYTGGIFSQPKSEARVVVIKANGNRRTSGIIDATAFLAFAIHFCIYLVMQTKRRIVTVRLLVVVSSNYEMSLANGSSFGDESSLRWTLFFKPVSHFVTSGAWAPDLSSALQRGTGHGLDETEAWKEIMSMTLKSL